MTQSELRFRKLNQAQHAGPWEGQSRKPGGRGGGWGAAVGRQRELPNALFPPGRQSWDTHSSPLPHSDAPSPPTPRTPVLPEVPPPSTLPASHTLCVCSSSGTPREGPAGGTGGSGGPGGSLGSRGRRRKLYSAVPGRSFMAVKSYQAQAEGEISLSKGEKIKGNRAGPGQAEGRAGEPTTQGEDSQGQTVLRGLGCPMHSGDPREALDAPLPQRSMKHSCPDATRREEVLRQKKGNEHLGDPDTMPGPVGVVPLQDRPFRRVSGAPLTVEGTVSQVK